MNDIRKIAGIAVAITLGVATAPAALGQASSVEKQLAASVEAQRKAGMVQASPDLRGSLENKKTGQEAVYLMKGVSYHLAGFCDNDCRRLDMTLLDERNAEVASHATTSDTPVLTVTPAATGRYTLRVVMADCTVDPCDWGVRVYAPR